MPTALVALFDDAPDPLQTVARYLAAAGAELLTLASPSGLPAVDATSLSEDTRDWIAVLARSHRIHRSAIAAVETELARFLPLASELASQANDRPLILLGATSTLGAIALPGSYLAVRAGSPADPIDLIGYRHAEAVFTTATPDEHTTSDPAATSDLATTTDGVIPLPVSMDQAPVGLPPELMASDGDLLILATEPLNADVSFLVIETLAALNGQGPQKVNLAMPTPLPDPEINDWANMLGITGRLVTFAPDNANLAAIARHADAVLCTSGAPEVLTHAMARAEAATLGIASVLVHPAALTLAPDRVIHTGTSMPELVDAILAASHPIIDSTGLQMVETAIAAVIEQARHFHVSPGPAFRALRQKQWELIYEGESADGYDDKYHAGACYVDLDRTLAAIVAEALPDVDHPRRILDLGCGPGSMVPFLQEIDNIDIVGVDVSPAMLRHARSRYPGVTFELGNTDTLLFDDGTFDVVLVSGVLHHLPVLRTTLDEISRVLVDDGRLIVREPNEDNLSHRHPHLALAHQGVRSLVLDHFGHRPHYEPEAHDDHIDFTPRVLGEALATVFAIEAIATAGVVSYFHDTLDQDQQQLVADLETTAAAQPGLNLFITARKDAAGRIEPDAAHWLTTFEEQKPVAANHVAAVIDTFATMVSMHPPVRQTIAGRLATVAASLQPGALVLAAGGVLADGGVLGEGGILAGHGSLANDAALAAAETIIAGDPTADLVSLAIDDSTESDLLETAASRIRDHGWLVVDLTAGANPTIGPESAGLTTVGVEPIDGGHRILARRHPLSAVDVVTALENLLANAHELIEPVSDDQLDAWRHKLSAWRATANFNWPPSAFVSLASLAETVTALV